MAYPNSVDTFTTKTDGIDDVMAEDINSIQSAVEAVETELGTLPKGAYATVKARLDYIEANTGAVGLAAAIHAATEKTIPVDADEIGIWDSVAGLFKKLTWANLKAHAGTGDLGAAFHTATEKTTPVDADEFGIWDSVGGLFKKLTWANIKATLKSYFDALYAPITGWIPANETWTFVTANSFSVSGDQTAKYRPGLKIKCTIGGVVKQAYIYSSSFGTYTTINVKGDDLVSGAITANYYSRIENPLGFTQWFAYTSTLTGFSTPSTVTAYFCIVGGTVLLKFALQGTSNATTFTITLPIPSASTGTNSYAIRGLDNTAWLAGASLLTFGNNVTVANILKDLAGSLGWTASGTKGTEFVISYAF